MEHLIEKLDDLYGLKVTNFEKVDLGFLSENFAIYTNNDKYFLKKYRFESRKRIEEIHAAKQYFYDGGIPVILPIQNKESTTYFDQNGVFYALFPFVEGKHIDRSELSKTSIVSLAETLAKIHLLGKEARLDISDKFKIEDPVKVANKRTAILSKISEITNPSDFDKTALSNIELKSKLLEKYKTDIESLQFENDHLTQGDYHLKNIFFDDSGSVEWVFDFEKSCYSPRLFEVFRSMVYIFLMDDFDIAQMQNAKYFIESYSKIYPLSKTEIRDGIWLYFLKSIHGLWVEEEHYLKGSTRVDKFIYIEYKKNIYFSEKIEELISCLNQ